MKRNFDIPFEYPEKHEAISDVSETGVEAVKTGEALTRGLDMFTPAQLGMHLIEKRLKREEYLQTIEGREEILEKELQAFGCSEKEYEQIKSALQKMADDESLTLCEGGERNRLWRIEKEMDGTFSIKMEIKEDEVVEVNAHEENKEKIELPETYTETLNQKEYIDEELGLTLEAKTQAPIGVDDISSFQHERRDITDEEDPARRASNVFTQQHTSGE